MYNTNTDLFILITLLSLALGLMILIMLLKTYFNIAAIRENSDKLIRHLAKNHTGDL